MRSERVTSSSIAHRPNKTLKDPEKEEKKKKKEKQDTLSTADHFKKLLPDTCMLMRNH